MKNKLTAYVLCIALLLTCIPSAYASGTVEYSDILAQTLLKTLNIMVGDENGNLNLDNFVSRAEFTKIAVAMSQYRNMVASSATTSMFTDVNYKYWAAPYIRLAVTNGIFTGYPDGTYKPDSTVLYEEAVTVMLRLLGYTDDDFGTSWPYGQIGIAKGNHITDNISKNAGDELCRGDVLTLAYNTLMASPKSSSGAAVTSSSQNAGASPVTSVNVNESRYLEKLDCYYYENTVIIATNKQNSGITPGYVYTSNGTFKTNDSFLDEYVGKSGDLIITNKDEFAAFIPDNQTVEKYVVYSKLDNVITAYHSGSMVKVNIDDKTTAYMNSTATTYANISSALTTGDILYVLKDKNGNIDYVNAETDNMSDAYTVTSQNWYSHFTNDYSSLTVMRDGVKSDISSVKTNDIVYYIKDLNTVFAYSKKITGVYEKATPNKDMLTSVTVSGTEYSIETVTAFNKLSSAGTFNFGDTVTLLLGKDGKIADAVSASSSTSSLEYGFLYKTGTKSTENSNGEYYTTAYACVAYSDGTNAEFTTDREYNNILNSVVSITFKDGTAHLSAVTSKQSVSGNVDASGKKIGTAAVASDVKILDVSTTDRTVNSTYKNVYMQRLDGMNISSSSVIYCGKNSSGEIDELFLNNATGDNYEYGIITATTKNGKNSSSPYTVNINGNTYTCNLNYGTKFSTGSPVGASISNGAFNSMISLTSVGTVKEVGDDYLTADGKKYKMSDNITVYKRSVSGSDTTCTVMPLNEFKQNISSLNGTAYCDKAEKNGGRIRVIVIRQ